MTMSAKKLLTSQEYLSRMEKLEKIMLILVFIIAGEVLFIHLFFSEELCDWQLETMQHRYEKELEKSYAD